MTQGASRSLIVVAATAATLAGIGGYALVESQRPAVLELSVFNTPGDPAILIRTPNDKRILVNGGDNSEIIERITDILPFYSRRIDTVIATDDDPKNVTGLVDVVNRYAVDEVIIPAITLQSLGLASSSDPIYETFLAAVDSHKIPLQEVSAGDRLTLDEPASRSNADVNDPVIAGILFPVAPDSNAPASSTTKAFQYSKASSPQIIMKIDYGTTSFMLMGDASIKVQKSIAADNELPADALVISNSATASNLAVQLIDSLAPDYLIYSQQLAKQGSDAGQAAEKKLPAASRSVASSSRSSSASGKSTAASDPKQKADPLAGVLEANRFNVREKGMVKIVSDAISVKISE